MSTLYKYESDGFTLTTVCPHNNPDKFGLDVMVGSFCCKECENRVYFNFKSRTVLCRLEAGVTKPTP